MAWHSTSIAFLLFPLLPPLSWFRVSPSVPAVFSSFWGFVHFTSTGLLASVTRAIMGAGCKGGLIAGLRVGRPVGVLLPWDVIAVAAPRPMGS